jgi:hypothetical protein
MDDKSFKDPVYGYIGVPSDLVHSVVDTQAFQRLRHIIQTSYEPLYPSATHNRFVHSLGVYHLGDFVARIVETSSFAGLEELFGGQREVYKRYLEVYRLACLLHDVGHAPFSHTGEEFYVSASENGQPRSLHRRIAGLLKDQSFAEEYKKNDEVAAPHELMSVVIGLVTYKNLFKSDAERGFFARAITGYKLPANGNNADGVDNSYLNCLISLLHSLTIDVDRLDYLIRDAFATGFKTVSVDYQRLLGGVRIRLVDGKCVLAFTKSAVSVLENVIYAHDAEKKWVQKHPAINYEMHLLNRAFVAVNEKYAKKLRGKTIFCEAALMNRGVKLPKSGGLRLRYLCDDDLLFLMKNVDDDSARKYLSRDERYLPLWKSEAEFCALFSKASWADNNSTVEDLRRLKYVFEALMKILMKNGIAEINDKTVAKLAKDAEDARKRCAPGTDETKQILANACIYGQKNLLCEFARMLKSFARRHRTPFHFQIFEGKVFTSGFATDKLPNLLVELGVSGGMVEFGKITNVLASRNADLPAKVYYLFGERWRGDKYLLARELVKGLKDFVGRKRDSIEQAFYSRRD